MFIAKKKKEEENLEGKRFKLSCLILTHPLTADRCEGKAKAEKVPGVLNTPGDLLLPLGLPDQSSSWQCVASLGNGPLLSST